MLTLEEMLLRLGVAVLLGAIVGLEREMAGKEAGIRTDIMVAAGSAIFSIAGITMPYLFNLAPEEIIKMTTSGAFVGLIANVVVGVGFLGAGIIVKQGLQVRGLTTAATVWFVAAVGVLAGIGLIKFAFVSALGLAALLFILRKINLYGFVGRQENLDDDTLRH